MTQSDLRFTVPFGKRIGMLLCTWLLCYMLVAVAFSFLIGSNPTATKLRISMVIQDIMLFVVPAIITAVIVTRHPATLLMVDRRPGIINILIVAIIIFTSMPVMNEIISWNQNLTLPSELSGIEKWMRSSEASASDSITTVMGSDSVGSLIISLLLIGVMAGFSEELFFRGALQRILSTSKMSGHAAVWISAFVFSAVHLQFFGFVPRLLLGAFFGYLALWSGSLWLAVAGHILNNAMAVTIMWTRMRTHGMYDIEASVASQGHGVSVMVLLSIVFTALWIFILYRRLTAPKIKCHN